MVCTLNIVLQSAKVSSSAELHNSLFTTTTVSARTMPARTKSSRLKKRRKNEKISKRKLRRLRNEKFLSKELRLFLAILTY